MGYMCPPGSRAVSPIRCRSGNSARPGKDTACSRSWAGSQSHRSSLKETDDSNHNKHV